MKNWFLGIMYRYIYMSIDTNVMKLLQPDFVLFVSIHTSFVSIQNWCLRGRESIVYRIMLACIDTHLYLSENQRVHDVSNHACMLRYISVKISRNWCMYRYTHVFVSIHRSKFHIWTLVKGFVSIQTFICIDTSLFCFA